MTNQISDHQKHLISLIKNRHSVRSFLPNAIPQTVLDNIFNASLYAPSNCNTQPWKVCVVSGNACDTLRKKSVNAVAQGDMSLDFPYEGRYEGIYKKRQHNAAATLYSALGIRREDKEKRNKAFMNNFRFFGAPHVAFLFIPDTFGIREAADIGMYSQTLMLSMTAHGIASCPQTTLGFISDLVREELNVDDSLKLLFGISFGYEDTEQPVNQCRTDRGTLNELVSFYD